MPASRSTTTRAIAFLIVLSFAALTATQAQAFWGTATKQAVKYAAKLGKIDGALPDSKIVELAELSLKPKGVSLVGKILGKKQLSQAVLEDTYMRILLKQGKVSATEADDLYRNLRGVDGFAATMRKISGSNPMQRYGHMNEILIADASKKYGFQVLGIGKKWDDGIKKGLTDIDVLLSKNGKVFAIEAKNYSSSTLIPLDKFRADMDTLVAFRKQSDVPCKPIFTITNKPADEMTARILAKEAERRGVELIYGSPAAQAVQIQLLEEIL